MIEQGQVEGDQQEAEKREPGPKPGEVPLLGDLVPRSICGWQTRKHGVHAQVRGGQSMVPIHPSKSPQ